MVLAATAGCGGLSQTRLLGSDTGGALTSQGFGLVDEIASSRVDVYRKKFPDVDLRINEGAFDAQQFLSAVASGRPPDLVYLDRELIGSYAHRGALQPLTSCVDRAGLRMTDYRGNAVAQTTVDGTLYAVPEFTVVQVVLVNGKAAADAGIAPADVDTSDWDGLAALGEKMTKQSGGKISRLGFWPKIPDFLPLWAHADGGRLLYTLPRGLKAVLDQFGKGGESQWEVVLAASVIATIPMVVVFLIAQRYFVQGISTTGRTG
ncbi:MAG TPA: extracellular solute-binding protein [Mycobacteriales bacterium]|nr:extracellular solute-binding protein [Mycobacteriales bacterium]